MHRKKMRGNVRGALGVRRREIGEQKNEGETGFSCFAARRGWGSGRK